MALLWASRKLISTPLLSFPITANKLAFHTLGKNSCGVITKKAPLKYAIQKRNYFWIFKKRTRREVRLIDNPPDSYELVYRISFDNYIVSFQFLSCMALTCIALAVIHRSSQYDHVTVKTPVIISEGMVPKQIRTDENHLLMLVAVFALVVVLTHLLISTMPVRIYYNYRPGKYLIYFYGMMPNRMKTLEAKIGEIKYKPNEKIVIPWGQDVYQHEPTGQKLILFENYFKVPMDLNIMLGSAKDPNHEHAQSESRSSPEKTKHQ